MVLENGAKAVRIRINNAWARVGPMDLSDIGYDAFLINGKKSSILSQAKPGTRIKLRIINAAASSYFIFEYSGGSMKVIESDGMKLEPFIAKKIRIAMAETYDVIVTIPENKTYEFRASSEDGTGYAVTHMGQGNLVPVPIYSRPNLVLMNMYDGMNHGSMNYSKHSNMRMVQSTANGMDHSAHQTMNMKVQHSIKEPRYVEFLNDYKAIKSQTATTLPKNNPTRTVILKLIGLMERYVWTTNIDAAI